MNYMENQSSKKLEASETQKLHELSESVGDFIRYWGFRRIHGEIWTQVFLSKKNLSGAELTERLGVSKSLISPALSELEKHGLIIMTQEDKKTKRYSAAPDVIGVIKKILSEREAKIIKTSRQYFESLQKIHVQRGAENSLLDPDRLHEIGEMILLAQFSLNFILGQSDENALAHWTEEAHKNQNLK